MNQELRIIHTDRCKEGIFTGPDLPNNITRQSAGTNNAPINLLLVPVICNPSQQSPLSTYLYAHF